MTDDVTVKFGADISALLSGLAEAASAVNGTTAAMRGSAAEIAASFGAISAAYANGAAAQAKSAKEANAGVSAADKERATASYQIALNGVKMNEALTKEQAQTSLISRDQEYASLLALEDEREAIERRHLQSTGASQAALELMESQSALRREQIELNYNKQVDADYKRTFDKIGSSVSSSIMGMIEGHESLRQAAQKILLGIIQDFIQARISMVANWAAGVAADVTTTQVGETQKTAAVVAGNAARTSATSAGAAASLAANAGAVIQQLALDAKAVFGGIFGFLAPFMGPAAAAPAASGAATVLGGIYDAGSWELPSDQLAMVHKGEMIVPAAQTPWAQDLMANASSSGGDHYHFAPQIHFAPGSRLSAGELRDHADTLVSILQEQHKRGAFSGYRPRR